jgi:hypothetical protein
VGVKWEQHSAESKARVATAALLGRRLWRSCRRSLGVDPTIISGWTPELWVDYLLRVLGRRRLAAARDLHRKIGQLQIEHDFLAGQPAISGLQRGGR